jgi:hypothetical protein
MTTSANLVKLPQHPVDNKYRPTLDACHEMVGYMSNVAQNQGSVEVICCLVDDHELGEAICTGM